jgi:hypothetical protein
MSCITKTKNTCGSIQFATCVIYEGYIPTLSSLTDSDCNVLEDIINDQYLLIEKLYSNTDLTILNGNGITYDLDANNKVLVKAAISKHAEEIVALKTNIQELLTGYNGDMDISDWGLDYKCLVDPCGDTITSLKQLMQILIDKACQTI